MDEQRFRADLARKMKQARIATWGPVQSQCASALKIDQSQISRWESATTLPRLTDLVRFARATGTTVEDLLGGSVKPLATQLLLGLDPEAQSVVVDLVEIIRTKTAEASRRQKRYRRKRA